MRRTIPKLPALAILLVLVAAACASIPPDRAVLNTLETVKASTISSMTVVGNLYKAGAITEPQRQQATELYIRIQAVSKAIAASLETVTTAQQAADLTKPLQDLSQQLANLVIAFQLGGAK